MTDAFDAIVIGGDANGLAAAATLARAGRRVLVLERSDRVGGDTRALAFAPGFRAAPLALDAAWLPPRMLRDLKLDAPALAPYECPIAVASPGESLVLPTDPSRAADTIRRYSTSDAAKWPEFAATLERIAGFLAPLYQRPAPDIATTSSAELLGLAGLAWKLRRQGRRHVAEWLRTMPMSLQELLDDWFESPVLKAAVAAGGVRDIRQGPRSGGTAFVLLHHLVGAPGGSVRGRGYWRAGPDAIPATLDLAARARGVVVRTDADVARILVSDYAVTGVALAGGEEISARLVLSSADPARTIRLVDPAWLDPEFVHAIRQIKFRGATAFVLYALDELPGVPPLPDATRALTGVVSLTPTVEGLERAYDAAKYGRMSERPHVEITAPTLRWPDHAPHGKHVLVARAACAPYRLEDGGWDAAHREALADRVTDVIACVAPGFADHVMHRAVLAPPDLEERYGLTEGAVSHGELTLDQILFMRPVPGWGHYSMPLEGLYLCGAATHPGPGVGGGPGWLAARQALRGATR